MLVAGFYFSTLDIPRRKPAGLRLSNVLPMVSWWLGLWFYICRLICSCRCLLCIYPLIIISAFLDVITGLYYIKTIPACKAAANVNFCSPLQETDAWWGCLNWQKSVFCCDGQECMFGTEPRPFLPPPAKLPCPPWWIVWKRTRCGLQSKLKVDGRQSISEVVPTLGMIDRSPAWLRVRGPWLHSASLMLWAPHPLQGKQNRRSFDTLAQWPTLCRRESPQWGSQTRSVFLQVDLY